MTQIGHDAGRTAITGGHTDLQNGKTISHLRDPGFLVFQNIHVSGSRIILSRKLHSFGNLVDNTCNQAYSNNPLLSFPRGRSPERASYSSALEKKGQSHKHLNLLASLFLIPRDNPHVHCAILAMITGTMPSTTSSLSSSHRISAIVDPVRT